ILGAARLRDDVGEVRALLGGDAERVRACLALVGRPLRETDADQRDHERGDRSCAPQRAPPRLRARCGDELGLRPRDARDEVAVAIDLAEVLSEPEQLFGIARAIPRDRGLAKLLHEHTTLELRAALRLEVSPALHERAVRDLDVVAAPSDEALT